MRRRYLSLFLPVLAGTMTAQAPEIRTATGFGIRATSGSVTRIADWPKGTRFTAQTRIMASTGSFARNGVFATALVRPVADGRGAGFHVQDNAVVSGEGPNDSGSAQTLAGTSGPQAPHAIEAFYRLPKGTKGEFFLDAGTVAVRSACNQQHRDVLRVAMKATVLAGGKPIEFTIRDGQNTRQVVAVEVTGDAGLILRIETSGELVLSGRRGSVQYGVCARVQFRVTEKPRCTFTRYGSACGAGTFRVTEGGAANRTVLTYAVRDARPRLPLLLVLGARRVGLRLPQSACDLLADPLVALPIVTDARGAGQLALPAPASAFGLASQLLGVDPEDAALVASAGIEARCGRGE